MKKDMTIEEHLAEAGKLQRRAKWHGGLLGTGRRMRKDAALHVAQAQVKQLQRMEQS